MVPPFDLILLFTAASSIALQLYVIWVIIQASPPSMRTYRYYLVSLTGWECATTVTLAYGLLPDPLMPWPAFISNGFFNTWGREGAYVGCCSSIFCAAMALSAQDFCMTYRMLTLLREKQWRDMFISWQGKLFSFVSTVITAIGYAIPIYPLLEEGALAIPSFVQQMNSSADYSYLASSITNTSLVVAMDIESKDVRIYAGAFFAALATAECLCLAMGLITFRILWRGRSCMSVKTYRLQLRLNILLAIQVVIPLCCFVLPFGALCLLSLLNGGATVPRSTGVAVAFILGFYGAANCLLIIVSITPYRDYTKQWIWRRRVTPVVVKGTSTYVNAPALSCE